MSRLCCWHVFLVDSSLVFVWLIFHLRLDCHRWLSFQTCHKKNLDKIFPNILYEWRHTTSFFCFFPPITKMLRHFCSQVMLITVIHYVVLNSRMIAWKIRTDYLSSSCHVLCNSMIRTILCTSELLIPNNLNQCTVYTLFLICFSWFDCFPCFFHQIVRYVGLVIICLFEMNMSLYPLLFLQLYYRSISALIDKTIETFVLVI